MLECGDCGLFQRLPSLPDGAAARCARCRKTLRRAGRLDVGPYLACALAAAALLVLALISPFLEVRLAGRVTSGTLLGAPGDLEERGAMAVGSVVFATLVALPALRIASWSAVLLALRAPPVTMGIRRLARGLRATAPWAMTEVFLLGVLVAQGRLRALGGLQFGPAFAALVAVVFLTGVLDLGIDPAWIWERASPEGAAIPAPPIEESTSPLGCGACGRVSASRPGEPCARCGARLHARKPDSVARTWALVVAAALLYVPSNVLPVLSLIRLGHGGPRTILGGVTELFDAGLWGLAGVLFCASIVIPLLKLVSLSTLLVFIHRRSTKHLRARTRLFRFVDAVGRWSMVDVFVLATLVTAVRAGFFAIVLPEAGATAFCAVVLLTMLAATTFDPRLMWDALEERA